ncbi:hypothetical protein H9660_11860 [Clostridium sp. Sa3CUN1]|uniref:Uncharacterized protein n=1 Tax=Clostridium gallinarum TaxID=2762246 RepID=A0ABR8Q632_9CLOT|nr:DUF6442 family protein [Clostridium gallinarum]MBD7915840.1 hypothetical protein [Clostridium gallinarum]
MKKDEILKKSRESINDEGIEYAENKGRKIGFISFTILFLFISIFNLFFGEPKPFYATISLFSILISGEFYGKYYFNKSKLYLIATILAIITTILFLIKFILVSLV